MPNLTDVLSQEYTIDTPENVSIGYSVAGIGNRFIAALVDSALLGLTMLLAQILVITGLAVLGQGGLLADPELDWRAGVLIALYALGTFLLIWGYYILFEWLWRGQTPGKRLSKIRVVRMDGSPPRFLDIAVRNLVRIIDFLPFAYGIGLVVMFFNRDARRLGDLAAGVLVVKDRSELRLEDVAPPRDGVRRVTAAAAVSGPAPHSDSGTHVAFSAEQATRFPTVRRLRVADYELIQDALQRHAAGKLDGALLARLAHVMAQKAGSAPPPTSHAHVNTAPERITDSRRMLEELAAAYRDFHAQDK